MTTLHTITAKSYTARVILDGTRIDVVFGWMHGGEFCCSPSHRSRSFKTEAGALKAARSYVAERAAQD